MFLNYYSKQLFIKVFASFPLAFSFIQSIWLQSFKSSLSKCFSSAKDFFLSFNCHVVLFHLLNDGNYCVIVKVMSSGDIRKKVLSEFAVTTPFLV